METYVEIVNMLNEYLEKARNDKLTDEDQLLLFELYVKRSLVAKTDKIEDKDMLKFTFLGYFMYNLMQPAAKTSDAVSPTGSIEGVD